jgi:hypothetical protein
MTLMKVDKKYLEISKCGAREGRRRSVGQDRVGNEEILYRVKEKRNILLKIK